MRRAAIAISFALSCACFACGREPTEDLGKTADSGSRDAPATIASDAADAADAADAPNPRIGTDCTNDACGDGLVCVHPTCAGGADAGPINCTPHFPFCAPIPAQCASAPNCACFPQDICMHMGSCVFIANGRLDCGNA